MATTYYHVIDEDNGEHIATYTDRTKATDRRAHERWANHRELVTVVTAIPTVTADSAVA